MSGSSTPTAVELADELARAEAVLAGISPATSGDPALARLGGAALRQHHRNTDSQLARFTAQAAHVEHLRGRVAAAENQEAENARVPLTAEDVKGARLVRDRFGWHKVVRCSAKSVTVETGYSWTDRIAVDKILEVRTAVSS